MEQSRLLISVALGLGLTLALLWMLRGPSGPALAEGDLTSIPPSLARQYDPIVITDAFLMLKMTEQRSTGRQGVEVIRSC